MNWFSLAMQLIARYKQLKADERQLFFNALLLVLAIRTALWILPFRITQAWVNRLRRPVNNKRELDRRTISKITWAVEAAASRIPQATCLTQGMTTQVLLGRMGQSSELHLGVTRKFNGKLEAHAWVEFQGRIIKGGAVEGFHRFVRLEK